MKKILTIIFLTSILVGCGFKKDIVKPEQPVAVKTEYVLRIPPAELMTIPPQVEKLDADNMRQSDVARWLISNEERTRSLENAIKGIASFFKVEQQKLLDAEKTKTK